MAQNNQSKNKIDVISISGKVVMHTDDKSCLYDKNTIYGMKQAGYTFRVDGKITSARNICKLLGLSTQKK